MILLNQNKVIACLKINIVTCSFRSRSWTLSTHVGTALMFLFHVKMQYILVLQCFEKMLFSLNIFEATHIEESIPV